MTRRRIFFLLLYAIGMAYVEAMVVVYLRRLLPLEGWEKITTYQELTRFIREAGIMWSEQTREFATLIMLLSVAYLFGKNSRERWGGFLITFGVWDIFYYVFLYLWLKWPPSFLTLDVLFLIPLPWVAPVILPLVISCGMIATGFWLLIRETRIVKTPHSKTPRFC